MISRNRFDNHCPRRYRRALSLVEAVVAMTIVGVTLVAALNTLGASRLAWRTTADRTRARLLAQQLMTEIMQQDYADPEGGTGLGRDAGEPASPRSSFDDADDYNGWSASPPEDADGNPIPETDGWEHSVTVAYADPLNLRSGTLLDTGVKRITVEVGRSGAVIASLTAVRTGASDIIGVLHGGRGDHGGLWGFDPPGFPGGD